MGSGPGIALTYEQRVLAIRHARAVSRARRATSIAVWSVGSGVLVVAAAAGLAGLR